MDFDIMHFMNIIITTLFGLESPTRDDLTAINYSKDQITVTDGVVTLTVPDDNWQLDVARVNMWVRSGERVFIELGSFDLEETKDPQIAYNEFFEKTAKIDWNEFIPKDYAFIVNGYSRNSVIYGVPTLQKLSKKAIVNSLKAARGLQGMVYEDENTGTVRIQFGVVKNHVKLMADTTGDGLHKRGYRPLTHEAPIRETLASGMIKLAHYTPFGAEALYDPFCGSGTIVIEACMQALNIAPGKNRNFAFESLPYIGRTPFRKALMEARELEDLSGMDDCYFFGSDIDSQAVASAKRNAEAAGVSDFIRFRVADAATLPPESLKNITRMDRQLVVTNPPYGGRLMTPEEADDIYRMIGRTYLKDGKCRKGIRLSVISPDDSFERAIGHKADKRVKLYNGNIKCQLNNFYKLAK